MKKIFQQYSNYLSEEAVEDLNSDTYLFGRGIMDMKAGLMLHLSLIELATVEQWDINLVLIILNHSVEMLAHYLNEVEYLIDIV